ncbi:UNVERIFIED_CONTAM: hypothetical protein B566_EDAN019542 [Ephemera danica]|nr:hypothetical protein B566_EDAN019542 [Ephemera danica]
MTSTIHPIPVIERMDPLELFRRLESNQPHDVEELKSKFHELFNTTKDSWLVNGFFEYYLQTNSTRAIEVLLVTESLRGPCKLQALTFLGHVVRKQPAWLYKIAQHSLLNQLLKLLKVETDILPMMSALLVLIVLLPMIPGYLAPYLQDIFEIFCRVASWNTLNPAKLTDETLVHLQPMLDSVKMHPLLVTASKDIETMQERWKNKGHHDVIVECAKFALERMHNSPALTAYRDEKSTTTLINRPQLQETFAIEEKPVHASPSLRLPADLWSPSLVCGLATPPASDIQLTPVLPSELNSIR